MARPSKIHTAPRAQELGFVGKQSSQRMCSAFPLLGADVQVRGQRALGSLGHCQGEEPRDALSEFTPPRLESLSQPFQGGRSGGVEKVPRRPGATGQQPKRAVLQGDGFKGLLLLIPRLTTSKPA